LSAASFAKISKPVSNVSSTEMNILKCHDIAPPQSQQRQTHRQFTHNIQQSAGLKTLPSFAITAGAPV
jgi:hypothetical protein